MNLYRAFSILCAGTLPVMMGSLSGCHAPFSQGEPVAESFPADSKNKAIQLDHKQKADIQMGLARTLESQGDLDRAETIYREILAAQPKYAPALHRLAIICDQQCRFDESKPLFRKAIDQASEDKRAVVWGDYGYSLYRQQKWKDAEETLRKALQFNPRDKRAHTHLGLVLAQRGQTEAAMEEFLLAGCSEEEAHSNLNTIRKLNTRSNPVPSKPASTQNPHGPSQPSIPPPAAEPRSTPARPDNQGTATVHLDGSDD